MSESNETKLRAGIELAAKWVEKRLSDYQNEHGSYDPETGGTDYPGNGGEYVGELIEIAEGIRALSDLSTETSGDQPPSGMVLAPHFRGYACLGAGAYVLSPCVEDGTPCLVIHIATDADKANREVGERRDTAEPGKLILPEQIAVRLDFISERGLFALEDMLAEIRHDHFAAPQLVERKAQPLSDNGAVPDGILPGDVSALRYLLNITSDGGEAGAKPTAHFLANRFNAERESLHVRLNRLWYALDRASQAHGKSEADVIAEFLQRTGQYVTNDASREAAIADAIAEDRAQRPAVPAAEAAVKDRHDD